MKGIQASKILSWTSAFVWKLLFMVKKNSKSSLFMKWMLFPSTKDMIYLSTLRINIHSPPVFLPDISALHHSAYLSVWLSAGPFHPGGLGHLVFEPPAPASYLFPYLNRFAVPEENFTVYLTFSSSLMGMINNRETGWHTPQDFLCHIDYFLHVHALFQQELV